MSGACNPLASDAHTLAEIAELLGEPLPADWQDQLAVQARQDHLAAVANIAGAVTVEAFAHLRDVLHQGAQLDQCGQILAPIADEVIALDRAMRDYTHQTQRGDAWEIAQAAVEASAGATLAALVMGLVERGREGQRKMMQETRGESLGGF